MSETINKKRNPLLTVLLLVAIIGSIAFWYFVLYAPIDFEQHEDSGSFTVLSAQNNATNLMIEMNADVGSYNIELLSEPSDADFEANWSYIYLIDTQQATEPAIDISVSNTTVNNVLTISINVIQEDNIDFFQMVELTFDIYVASSFELYNVSGIFGAASVDVDLGGLTFGDINLDTSVGSYDIQLADSILTSNVAFITSTGSIDISLEDVVAESAVDMSIESSVGSIDMDWFQSVNISSDINLLLTTQTGSINYDMNIKRNVAKLDISFETSVGSADFDYDDGEMIAEDNYQTENFASLELPTIFIDASTSVGSLDMNIQSFN